MNVLLIYPKYPDTFWSFKHVLKFISKKAAFPPLGLLTVGAMLPRSWRMKLVDVNITELQDEQIIWADMVMVSAMIIQGPSAQEIINRCKAHGKTVVMGGPAATTRPEKFQGVDHFVLNEAEITLPRFLADWEKGTPQPIYTSSEKPDMIQTPVPLWSLIDFKDYATMAVQFSRGCPFDCEFCDIVVMFGRVPRTKTPAQMVAELQSLYEAGWNGDIFVVDDNLIGNKVKVKEMLRALIQWQKDHRYPYRLSAEVSTNLADDTELMQLMSAANFSKVFLGIETPNVASLKECNKYHNADRDLEKGVRIIQQNGLQVMGGFIIGFDNDTETIFDAQIKFIQKVGIVTAMVGVLNALPQTRLWHRLNAENRLLADTTGENTDGSINFIPVMGVDKLSAGYRRVLATLYSPKQYYKRIYTFIRHYRPTAREKITFMGLRAYLRSIWRIGILSRARMLYWKLLIKTSFRNIKALPIAVELAIYGLHFEKITRKVVQLDTARFNVVPQSGSAPGWS